MLVRSLHTSDFRNLHEVAYKPHPRVNVIFGDNGQGKTTFLRTIVDSLKPLTGEARWGYGCDIGVYAQHVYTGLPENLTVLCIIAIGYPGEKSVPYKKEELHFDKVSYNRYGQKKP